MKLICTWIPFSFMLLCFLLSLSSKVWTSCRKTWILSACLWQSTAGRAITAAPPPRVSFIASGIAQGSARLPPFFTPSSCGLVMLDRAEVPLGPLDGERLATPMLQAGEMGFVLHSVGPSAATPQCDYKKLLRPEQATFQTCVPGGDRSTGAIGRWLESS